MLGGGRVAILLGSVAGGWDAWRTDWMGAWDGGWAREV